MLAYRLSNREIEMFEPVDLRTIVRAAQNIAAHVGSLQIAPRTSELDNTHATPTTCAMFVFDSQIGFFISSKRTCTTQISVNLNTWE
jgi:hypothetical protein